MTKETLLKISQSKAKTLTFPERKFVMGVVAGLNPTQSAKQAYPTQNKNSLKVTATRNMKKPKIKTAIERALVKANLSEDRLTGIIDEALSRDKPNTIDWNTTHSFLSTALKLKGYLNNNNSIQIQTNIGLDIE